MLDLKVFGSELRRHREGLGDSVAKFAKETGGVSQQDIRDFEAGKRVPNKVTIKKLLHCFPALMAFENDLRHADNDRQSETRLRIVPKWQKPKPEPTRLKPVKVPRCVKRTPEIINPLPPPVLSAPIAPVLTKALRKTHSEMLTELTRLVTKRLGALESEEFDFTVKNDGVNLVVKLRVAEGEIVDGERGLVDSGCYIGVGPRAGGRIGVFCKTMTSGNVCDMQPRMDGARELIGIAQILQDAVKDRTFE